MYCSSCGAELANEAVVCVKCGRATPKFKEETELSKAKTSIEVQYIVAAYIAAVVIPIVGFIMGIYFLAKGKIGHGIGAMVTSAFMTYFWIGFFGAL